ncbi:hypothetical protein CPter91_3656 [Collimonas pratensis]|jgi:hypothetical protein|uniref:Ribbon-helix-helix, copG family protein n=1 Tax=Collimonas pratensis TaxID=279113 RepID=A0A127Q7G6_9BURK|nr:hypothetical protein CPter91_3656 [Collimonas pratensis]
MDRKPKARRAPKNCLSKQIVIRLLPDEVTKTDQFAEAEIRSRASFIRIIFLRGLQVYEHEQVTN